MIEGVKIIPLKQIIDERGKVMHMLKVTDPHFIKFGEIYFSLIHPNVIKGWHLHKKMIINYAVVTGKIKLVLYDDREDSETRGEFQEIYLGQDNYCLVCVPPYVWNGFKCVGTEDSIVANCSTIPHDPDEIVRLNPFDPSIPYDWAVKHG
ncbi:dTDP-4-dehydrorhamnose 3,5-epimerase [uncultured archaeon]|nr:dTDP-4-dehydrorhamnose 3,5-epimerase [uncultured archaeon]